MSADPIRVAVLAGSYPLRLGLQTMLAEDPGIEIVDPDESRWTTFNAPDVLVLAGRSARSPSIEALLQRNEARPGLVYLIDEQAQDWPAAVQPAETPGVAVLSLSSGAQELAAAVRAAAAGLWAGDRWLLEALRRPAALNGDSDEALTPREMDVLQQLAAGLANKQIAAALNLSENTVKFHIAAIYGKLGAGNRAEAVRLGARRGLISL